MDLSTAAAVAGIALLSAAAVSIFASIERAPARVVAIGKRRDAGLAIVVSVLAAAYLACSSSLPPVVQAGPPEEDPDVARLRAFASTLSPPKHAPMSLIPTRASHAPEGLPDVDTMIDKLAARLSDAPEDGEGWTMLGWSLLHTDRPADAAKAYAKARMLKPGSEDIGAALAEAMIARDGGTVGDEAQAIIEDVLRMAPELPKARYFKALARSQRGELAAALADMKAIEASTDSDALWIDQMRARIAHLSASDARLSE